MSINPNLIKKFKKKFAKFMESHRTDTADFTHLSMGGLYSHGRFNISDKKDLNKLVKYLAEALELNMNFSILEKPKDYGPLKVDIDLRYPKDSESKGKRLYDEEMILETVKLYRDAVRKLCDVKNPEVKACVFEKEKMNEKNNNWRDGFHIIFPSLCLPYQVRHLIRNNVVEEAKKSDTFLTFSNEAEDIFDSGIISSNSWLMYGCSKPNCDPYFLTKYLDHTNNRLETSSFASNTRNIIKLLSLRSSKWSEENANVLNSNLNDEQINSNFEKLNVVKSDDSDENNFFVPQDKEELINNCRKLVDMFKKSRAENYHTWIRVGWALHNTDPSLLGKWVEFSKKSKKYKKGECKRLWSGMRDKGLTYRSLILWAKEDDINKYNKFAEETFQQLVKKNDGMGTFWIAKALHNKYFDKFVCTNPEKNDWFEYKNNRWCEIKGGGKLIELMSTDFANSYRELVGKYNGMAISATNTPNQHKFDTQADKFKKIAMKLMDISFKKKILEEAKNLFHDEKFFDRLDENHDLIGFENGVYDLKLHKFRKGQPDDYISLSTKVNYIQWNPKNPISKQIMKFLGEIIPNNKVKNYFEQILSTCISGDNNEEKIYFATGSGSNGKSVLFDLISNSLGEYYISCPITILTRKRGMSGQASPELARFKGARIGVFQEPDSGETFNVGILKELTGNDKFMARQLHKDPIEVKPQIKLFMTCNDLPNVPSNDGGTWRRIRVIDFISKFVEKKDLDPNKKNQYLMDNKLKHKLPDWGPVFAGYLVNIYREKYCKEKLIEPPEVLKATNNYRCENDFYREYFDFRIEQTNDKGDIIGKRPLWNDFKSWFKEFKEGQKHPPVKKLYEFVTETIGKPLSKGWKGIKFKYDDSDSEDEKKNDLDL
jgi:P4 family phage/plasmid primase-like protien